jgi:hypothetical protein
MPAIAANNNGGIGSQINDYGFNGKHYTLNFIGVPHDKMNPMQYEDGSKRNTIFVPLNANGEVSRKVKIYYTTTEANQFAVLDANATDDNVAVIEVPHEYCADYETGCEELLSFAVFAVGLGKPNGMALVDARCQWDDDNYGDCAEFLSMNTFTIRRTNNGKNKPKVTDISDVFRVNEGCIDLDYDTNPGCTSGDIEFGNLWIFNIEQLFEYYWDYDNQGLKLMHTRFYPTTSGYIGYIE